MNDPRRRHAWHFWLYLANSTAFGALLIALATFMPDTTAARFITGLAATVTAFFTAGTVYFAIRWIRTRTPPPAVDDQAVDPAQPFLFDLFANKE